MQTPKIISGGQTGADQGGLFAARDLGFPTGGWAPRLWMTEDGPRPDLLKKFGLKESDGGYPKRTRLNVYHSDFTIWFGKTDSPGFAATLREAKAINRPFFLEHDCTSDAFARLLIEADCVNVAGNRESGNPGIFSHTRKTMTDILNHGIIIKSKK